MKAKYLEKGSKLFLNHGGIGEVTVDLFRPDVIKEYQNILIGRGFKYRGFTRDDMRCTGVSIGQP